MINKILFIVNQGVISSDTNGGSSVYFSHLKLLYKAGFQIELLAVQWSDKDAFNAEDYKAVEFFIHKLTSYKIEKIQPKKGVRHLLNAVFKPELFEYNFINNTNNSYLQNYIAKNQIDCVFSEWRWAAIWSVFAGVNTPVVYSHHDWEYKLAKLRIKRTVLQKLHTYQKKRVEYKLVKKASACISGSFTEAEEIKKITHKNTLYLPTTYSVIKPELPALNTPNIVHLGGMETTANRIGLERFLDVCWNKIQQKLPTVKLFVIGSLKQAPQSLLDKLNKKNIICKGFVADLQTVLHPQDIHIIPWEHNTGTRTRIPVVLNFEQVLVATKAAVSCFPEINTENSVLSDNLDQMSADILNLYSNKEKLHLLSSKGKQVFLNSFTIENQQKKIKNFLLHL